MSADLRTAHARSRLDALARRFVDNLPLPTHIRGDNGALMPLVDWLTVFQFDYAEFPFDLAGRLGLQRSPPFYSEAASTIRARLAERHS